jgi:hypothetical protein
MDVREYYMDTRSNSRANTCKNARPARGRVVFIGYQNQTGLRAGRVC